MRLWGFVKCLTDFAIQARESFGENRMKSRVKGKEGLCDLGGLYRTGSHTPSLIRQAGRGCPAAMGMDRCRLLSVATCWTHGAIAFCSLHPSYPAAAPALLSSFFLFLPPSSTPTPTPAFPLPSGVTTKMHLSWPRAGDSEFPPLVMTEREQPPLVEAREKAFHLHAQSLHLLAWLAGTLHLAAIRDH